MVSVVDVQCACEYNIGTIRAWVYHRVGTIPTIILIQ